MHILYKRILFLFLLALISACKPEAKQGEVIPTDSTPYSQTFQDIPDGTALGTTDEWEVLDWTPNQGGPI